MPLEIVKSLTVDHGADFRGKAALGVALTALILLLPFAVANLLQGNIAQSVGIFGIVAILAINALRVLKGQEYQVLTLYGLVPAGMLFMSQVFLHDGVIGSLWCFPSILGSYCMLSQRRARIANGIILLVAIPMAFHTLDIAIAARVAATLVAVSLFAAIVVQVIDDQQDLLRRQAQRDPLTGLLNRMSLRTTLEAEIAQLDSRPSCLLALDLDHFKRINDTYGHEMGDSVLCSVSDILLAETNDGAYVFRPGGEEFLIVLPDCTRSEAEQVAERLRRSVRYAPLLDDGPTTVSIGVAALCAGDDWMSWMRAGDAQLYAAKQQGRDRVMVADRCAERALEAAREARSATALPVT